ncbi:MAG: TM2 domain-containing protein [Oligosphaeraceae bacterium]
MENNAVQDFMNKPKNKVIAGVVAIFLGWLGIHKFYLGYNKAGIIQLVAGLAILVLSWLICRLGIPFIGFVRSLPVILGIVEGVLYLTKSDEEFQKIYVEGKKEWL